MGHLVVRKFSLGSTFERLLIDIFSASLLESPDSPLLIFQPRLLWLSPLAFVASGVVVLDSMHIFFHSCSLSSTQVP